MNNKDKAKLRIEDPVKHKQTGLHYIVDGSIHGAYYNDGEQDWVNVKYGINHVHYFAFPIYELIRLNS